VFKKEEFINEKGSSRYKRGEGVLEGGLVLEKKGLVLVKGY